MKNLRAAALGPILLILLKKKECGVYNGWKEDRHSF